MRLCLLLLAVMGCCRLAAQDPGLDQKIRDLTADIQTNNKNISAYIARSEAYEEKGDYTSAAADCQTALALDPKNHLLWRVLGYAHYMLSSFDMAVSDDKKALRFAPRDTIAWKNLGLAYYYKKQYDSAIKMFDQAINLDSRYLDAYAGRANAFLSSDKSDRNQLALKDYSQMIRINPNLDYAWYYRAWLDVLMGEYDLAIADAGHALQLNPKYGYAWYELAIAYYDKQQYDQALDPFTEFLKYDPTNYDSWNFRGFCYFTGKKYDSALWNYMNMIAMQPQNATGWYWAGNVYGAINKKDSAMYFIDGALHREPDRKDALSYRAGLYFTRGQYDSAIADYDRILSVDPKNSEAWNSMGLTDYNLGRYSSAISEYKQALKIDSLNSAFMTNLIMAYMADQQFDKAVSLSAIYQEKNLSGYADKNKTYSFVKKYIEAAEFLRATDYDGALPFLLTTLQEYKESDTSQDNNPYVSSMYSNVLATLAFVYQQLGDKEKALEYYKKSDVVSLAKDLQKAHIEKLQDDISSSKSSGDKGPQIQLLSPAVVQGNTVAAEGDGKLFVSGMVQSTTGIDWVRINGNNVTVQSNGYFSFNLAGDLRSFVIQAEGKDGRISSVNYQLQTTASTQDSIPGIASGPKPMFHAVLIACSNYTGDKWQKLSSTIDEAKSYKTLLTQYYGFDKKNILELYDKSGHDILASLSSKLESLNENDNLIVLFAGHGTYRGDGNDRIGYWVPLNANDPLDYISNIKLTELIIGCKAKHILLLSDACYSSAMRGGDIGDDNSSTPQKYEFNLKSRQVLTSGGLEKVPGNSIFVDMVEKVLRQNGQKYLSVKELYGLIFNAVKNQTNNQPELNMFGSNGNEGGQFYFIRSN